ncbi:MAG: phosphotransferase family protein [Cyclobacteriaceae bacterium]|nr:phosphotransferase family protein [Cyclobacteriaceae bacterium]
MISSDQPVSVRQGEEIDLKSLNKHLKENSSIGFVTEQKQFPGGYSNLTYLLTTGQGEYVLRRPPAGAAIKSAHDMGREFNVLSLLKNSYSRIPAPIIYCQDEKIIGSTFYIMERIKGVILRPSSVKEIRVTSSEMRKISESLVDNLAALHSLDIAKTNLSQLGKPEGYVQRQVEGWTKRYIAAQTDPITQMDEISAWLSANLPAEVKPTLLHNDYKYDNLVLNSNDLSEIIGVLDWEMATVGDPGMDLGASLAYWAEEGDGDLAKVFNISWLPGNLTRKEVVERYTEKSGRMIINPVFYYVFGLYKNAVIAQQIYARWKQGHSKDGRFGTLIHVIKDLARRGANAINTNSLMS